MVAACAFSRASGPERGEVRQVVAWRCRATCLDYERAEVGEGVLGGGEYDVSDFQEVGPKVWI